MTSEPSSDSFCRNLQENPDLYESFMTLHEKQCRARLSATDKNRDNAIQDLDNTLSAMKTLDSKSK